MSGNYQDGVNQASFDRYTEEREFYDRLRDNKGVESEDWSSRPAKHIDLVELVKQPLVEDNEE